MRAGQPNIVFILADQLRYSACGYAGDAKARTPHIDGLAAESVSFSNAVASMPVCSAFRASLFTGKYTTSTGMVINELRMQPDHECLGHCLTRAGYSTGYIGKWHLYANELGHHEEPRNSFVPPGPHRLGFDGYWAGYNFHHDYYGAYYHTDTPEKIAYGEGVYEPDGQTGLAIDFIGRQRPQTQPFALFLSYGTPHDPWTAANVPPAYYDLFRDMKFPAPANYRPKNEDPYGDTWSDIPHDPARLDEWMRVYYAMTANLDDNVGRLLQALADRGFDRDTLVVFGSDHGEMFGAHGRMKKNIFYDEAACIPLLMRLPGIIPAGQVSDACLSSVDIMPTLLGLTGLDIPAAVEGMDLSHCARGTAGPEPAFAFMQNTGACAVWEDGHEWRALRDKQYTYAVFRADGAELLFDHERDPLQEHNLATDPASADILPRFRAVLKARMTELNDTFPASTWYRDNWISPDRIILRTAASRD